MSDYKNVSCTKTHPHCQTAATDEERSDAVEKLRTLHKNRDFMRSVVQSLVDVVTNGDNELNNAVFTDNVSLTK